MALKPNGDFGGSPHKTSYEVVTKDGTVMPQKFDTASGAGTFAHVMFPDQEQDEDRTGSGWDVQVVGCGE